MKQRCDWAQKPELMQEYHDAEWGSPLHDDRKLFEFLVLDAMQAGLSWWIVLKKRDAFRQAFDNFDARKIARYDRKKIQILLKDPGIVRNRLKIESTVTNAQAFLKTQKEFGSFDRYIWDLAGAKPQVNRWKTMKQIPAYTEVSDRMSKELKGRGFRFVGSTICYAFMQASGMVNDHLTSCFRYKTSEK